MSDLADLLARIQAVEPHGDDIRQAVDSILLDRRDRMADIRSDVHTAGMLAEAAHMVEVAQRLEAEVRQRHEQEARDG